MHKAESVLENEKYKIFWNFEIKTDHLFLARRSHLVLIKKKELVIWWILSVRRTTEGK